MQDAALLVTDSGGVQEEATALGIPCATLRENTERPVTITLGTNVLLPLEVPPITSAARDALEGRWKQGQVPPLWDGHAAERIAAHIAQHFS
jgi:UDP-N-acetylglucosamine 2-epimerase (non-hydrolysing)